MTSFDKWQKLIDQIWQEPFAAEVIRAIEARIKRIRELKAAGVKPKRGKGKMIVPK